MAVVVIEERINLLRANYLLDNFSFEEFYNNFNGTAKDAHVEYDKMKNYLSSKICTDYPLVKYKYSKGKNFGRLFGENSIQTVKKDIRGFLCDGITTDIDMRNAHPSILYKICEIHNILTPNLKLYIDNRMKCLEEVMEKDQLSYEEAKKKTLLLINSNKYIYSRSQFFKSFEKEIKFIQKEIIKIEDYDEIKEFAKKEGNFEGSFINLLLCKYENIILGSMRNFCDINEIKIHSLMFDGLMIYGNINECTLRLMEEHITNNTEFDNIELCIKEHEYHISIPEDYTPIKKETYEKLKERFEKDNCKVGCKFINITDNFVDIYGIQDFKVLHEELKYFENGKEYKFIRKWFEDENKRRYDRFDCIPKDSLCPENVFNLWAKFPVQLMPEVDNDKCKRALEMFLDHTKVVMCNDNEIHYQFFLTWMAQMFQYPENKSIMPVFVGEEGAGKGVWIKFMQTIMGGGHRGWECTDPQEEIFGKFNDNMKDAYLVILNEADKSGTFNHNNKFKSLITDPNITIRPKGKTNFNMKSCHRFISFSNNVDPNLKNKRRDLTFKMSNNRVDDVEYFNELHSYSVDIECCKYIYDYLMGLNIKATIVNSDIPVVEYDEMLREQHKDHFLEFMEHFTTINRNVKDEKFYTNSRLYGIYLEWCKENYVKERPPQNFLTTLASKNYNNVRRDQKWHDKKNQRGSWFNFTGLIQELNIKIPDDVQIINYDSDTEIG